MVKREDADWKHDLEAFVRSSLARNDSFAFDDFGRVSTPLPIWMDAFEISVNSEGIEVRLLAADDAIQKLPTLSAPFFSSALAEYSPARAVANPLQALIEQPPDVQTEKGLITLQSRWTNDCGKAVRYVAKKAGLLIKQRFEASFKSGVIELYALDADPSQGQFQIKPIQFRRSFNLANTLDTLTFDAPYCRLSGLMVHCPKAHKQTAKTQKSFAEQDRLLIEHMKRQLDRNTATTIKEAAEVVAGDAQRKPNAEDASVVKRLTRGFTKAYPEYQQKQS